MQELKVEADLYEKEGYPEFYPAYEEYKTVQRKYEDKGYSQEMLEKIRIYFQTQEQVLAKKGTGCQKADSGRAVSEEKKISEKQKR